MLVYEDAVVHAYIVPDGVAVGHIEVLSKQSATYFDELPEDVCVQMWYAASFAATAVFEGLGAQGTNILAFEGDKVAIHVLPRAMNDGLDIQWEMKRADPADLTSAAKSLSEAMWYIGKKELATEQPVVEPKPEVVEKREPKDLDAEDKKIDYRLKQLNRRM